MSVTIGSIHGNQSGNIAGRDIHQSVTHHHYANNPAAKELQDKIDKLEQAITAQLNLDTSSRDEAFLNGLRQTKAEFQQQLDQIIEQTRTGPQIDMEALAPYAEGVDLLLVIKRDGDQLGWGWLGSDGETGLKLTPPKTFSQDDARDLIKKEMIDHLEAGGLTGQQASNTLQGKGQHLAEFIPPAVNEVLAQTKQRNPQAQLLLLTNDIYTPWELAYFSLAEKPDYLHRHFIMGRWPLSDTIPAPSHPLLELHQMTVVAGEYGQTYPRLPHAKAEQKSLLDRYGGLSLGASKKTREQLLQSEPVAGHLLHCIVHGMSDQNKQYIRLEGNDGRIAPSNLMGQYQPGDTPRFSFVFLNACSVGSPGQSLGELGGFPGDFLRGGVQGFIAPLWKIHDESAKQFAEQFYQGTIGNSFNPMTVGQTLYDLRQQYQPDHSVTPLAYIYYGHPGLVLKIKGGRFPTAEPTLSPPTVIQASSMSEPVQFNEDSRTVDLEGGYRLTVPGMAGQVQPMSVEQSATRSGGGKLEAEWITLLDQLGLAHGPVFEMDVTQDEPHFDPTQPALRADGLTATTRSGEPAFIFEMPRPSPEQHRVLLYTDEAGIAHWIWPTANSTEEKLLFHLPRSAAPVEQSQEGEATRGPLGWLGRKSWRVIIPWASMPVQKGAAKAVEFLENEWYPYQWRTLQPDGFHPIDRPDWSKLQQGRALLLIHGTFSKAESAFKELPPETIQKLHHHYGGRIIAFNHPSMHQDPRQNIAWLLANMPDHIKLDLDIVAHSRGGLVGRELCHRLAEYDNLGGRKIRIHKAVLVAAPNQGSILTSGDKLTYLLDRFTNFSLEDPIVMPMIFGLSSLLAHGGVSGLPGLQSMLPPQDGNYLFGLNVHGISTNTKFYALGAKFVPTDPGWQNWLWGSGKQIAMDSTFGEDNDLIVPTVGSYQAGHNLNNFHIPPENRLILEDGTHHNNFFAHPKVNEKIIEWLLRS